MKHSDGRFVGAGGSSIFFQYWEPETTPKAVVLLAHGAAEHSARYDALARFFTGHNYVVAALDHNGHGYSEGTPGHVRLFDDYLHDLEVFHRLIAERYVDMPLFLLGHSMGGLIGINYLLRHQQDFIGAVLSGPAIKTELKPGRIQMALLRFISKIAPRLRILKLDAEGVSRDPDIVRNYVEDPLVYHGKMSACLLRELFVGMSNIEENAAAINLPILILHGGADTMTAPEGSRFLHQHISSGDKTLQIYPSLYHEIFNEPERVEVLDDVLQWLDAKLATT